MSAEGGVAGEVDDLLTRFTNALDCCGTCAGGVLAARVREAEERAWMDGAFYYGGDAAEQWYFNDGGSDCNPHRLCAPPAPTTPTATATDDGAHGEGL